MGGLVIEVKELTMRGGRYYNNPSAGIRVNLFFGSHALVSLDEVNATSWLVPDCWDWLIDHAGRQNVHWSFHNLKDHDRELIGFTILFPDKVEQRHVALLFKLTWGGS